MKDSTQARPIHQETTYQMLINAEEKERNVIEDIVYLLLVIATAVTIFQFGREPVKFGDLRYPQAWVFDGLGTAQGGKEQEPTDSDPILWRF